MSRPFEILLFEDNAPDVFIVRTAIEESGIAFHLTVCTDGEQAVNRLQQIEEASFGCPDLLLLDLNMPKYGGEKILAEFRKISRCEPISVIVMTSSDSPKDRALAESYGVDYYFQKPPDLDQFLSLGKVIKALLAGETDRAQEA